MANLKNNTASLQALISIAGRLPMENEYLDELNFINGETSTTMENAVGQTESLVANEANVISEIITTLSNKINPNVEVFTTSTRLTANNQEISFTGLPGEPKIFSLGIGSNITLNTSNRFVIAVTSIEEEGIFGSYAYGSGNSWNASYTVAHSSDYFTTTYNNGTLTVRTSSTTNGGVFAANVTYAFVAIC